MVKGTPSDMTLIDTHCHLNDRHAFPDPSSAIKEAVDAGVVRLVVVGIDTASSQYAVELAEMFDQVFAVVGWHPNHASEFSDSEIPVVRGLLQHPKTVALGEIGLDYYRDHATREEQYRCLQAQLELAGETGLPVVFHCRDAYDDLLDVLEAQRPHKWLFHCYAGDANHARRAVSLNAWFGVDGPVTYKSNEELRELLKTLPREKLLVETDAPWMSPVPYRGQRNRPAWVSLVNAGLATTLGMDLEECAAMTSRNARDFFGDLGLD